MGHPAKANIGAFTSFRMTAFVGLESRSFAALRDDKVGGRKPFGVGTRLLDILIFLYSTYCTPLEVYLYVTRSLCCAL
jgi:hypothetical protein